MLHAASFSCFFSSTLVRVARFGVLLKHVCNEEKLFFNLSQLNIL